MDAHSQAIDFCQKADVASDVQRYAQAEELARQAIGIDPGLADAYGSLSRALIGQSRFAEAADVAREAIGLEPDFWWYHLLLARCQLGMGQSKQAVVTAEESARLAPYLPHVHDLVGDARMACEDYALAMESYERGLLLDGEHTGCLAGKGRVLIELERYREAESFYRAVLEQEPVNSVALNNLGICLEGQKDHKRAALAYKAAVLADPSCHHAKSNTLRAVNQYLPGPGTMTTFLIMGWIMLLVQVVVHKSWTIFLIGILLTIVLVVVYRTIQQRRAEASEALKLEDPQLWEVYDRIQNFGVH